MQETNTSGIMNAFLDALAGRDFARARTLLANDHFRYNSPLSTFSDPDAFIADISRWGPILERIERRRSFCEGPEVCVITRIQVRMAELSSINLVLWATIAEGKIIAMEAFFDAREYEALFNG